MAPEFDLEAHRDEVRRRLGWDVDGEGNDRVPSCREDREDGRAWCPAPTLDDVRPAARLRDRLAAALNAEDDAT